MLPKTSQKNNAGGAKEKDFSCPCKGLAGSVSMLWKWISLEGAECSWLKQHPSSLGKCPKLQYCSLVLARCLGAVVVGRPVAKRGGAVISWFEYGVQTCSGRPGGEIPLIPAGRGELSLVSVPGCFSSPQRWQEELS